jgi:hypothetical protein
VIEDKQNFVITSQIETAKKMMKSLEDFVNSLHDPYVDVEAWSVFHVWQDREFKSSVPYFSVFRAWQMFKWEPDPDTLALPLDENCKTIAEAYLKLKRATLEPEQIALIERSIRTCPDFFEIQSFDDEVVTATGTINKSKFKIYHPGLSRLTRSGDYLMAHLADAGEGVHILLGTSQPISRSAKSYVTEFCRFIELSNSCPNEFQSIQSDFLNLFYDLLRNPSVKR